MTRRREEKKIQPEHLARAAFVYVRQSTIEQVRHRHESRRRQYGLAEHARALGWQEVIVIDDDLGKSGASASGRVGFQRLVATGGLGQAGAVFGLEVSRLARNNRDWYQLIDLCGLMNTLIVDAEGVYDPRCNQGQAPQRAHRVVCSAVHATMDSITSSAVCANALAPPAASGVVAFRSTPKVFCATT